MVGRGAVMGSRPASETVARILVAFLREPTWSQAALARTCEVSSKQVKRHLDGLAASGMPLEREEDHPHVYWSVPRGWFPGGLVLERTDAALVARLLARLPRTDDRERAVSALLRGGELPSPPPNSTQALGDDAVLTALEDAARDRIAVSLRYLSLSRGDRDERDVSVHRIVYGRHPRFVALCHRANGLKWFRVDRADRVAPAEATFRDPGAAAVDEFVATSFGGFRRGAPIDCAVAVRAPRARWVVQNLPEPMTVEHRPDEICLRVRTAGLENLARFVVGLGADARAETPELRAAVLELAQGAARAHRSSPDPRAPLRKVSPRSVRPKAPTPLRPRPRVGSSADHPAGGEQ